MTRTFNRVRRCVVLALVAAATGPWLAVPAHADQALDALARDVARAESVRAVLTLQRSYAQYAQFGLWSEVGALFAPGATFTFDGLVLPAQTATGPAAIAAFLRTRYGGGQDGPAADGLSSMFIDNPLVNLSADGRSAKARWNALIFHGHGGQARIEGGIFENDYRLDGGVWAIAAAGSPVDSGPQTITPRRPLTTEATRAMSFGVGAAGAATARRTSGVARSNGSASESAATSGSRNGMFRCTGPAGASHDTAAARAPVAAA